MKLMESIRAWMERRRERGPGGGLLGEPGPSQRPGLKGGGPGEGPSTGGSVGPAAPE